MRYRTLLNPSLKSLIGGLVVVRWLNYKRRKSGDKLQLELEFVRGCMDTLCTSKILILELKIPQYLS